MRLEELKIERELPSEFAERVGLEYANLNEEEHKKNLGQYFTPLFVSRFMAALAGKCQSANISILDPGCGTGVLSCALIEELVLNSSTIKTIKLIAYELDLSVHPFTKSVFIILKKWCLEKGVRLTYKIKGTDFVIDNTPNLFTETRAEAFDFVITNPPYFKINKKESELLGLKGANNIYSVFLTIGLSLLKETGQLIFISPRSFTAGKYFRDFRKYFFNNAKLDSVCLIASRKKTFARDKVLQENIIVKATKSSSNTNNNSVRVSLQTEDLYSNIWWCVFQQNELVNCDSFSKILHLPTSGNEYEAIELAKTWPENLNTLGFVVSTGPVVDFRNKESLINSPNGHEDTGNIYPLMWYSNIQTMNILWPIEAKNKPQFISKNSTSQSLLIPSKNYVIIRRFSPKEGENRIVAAPYLASSYTNKFIGIENHLNYIKKANGTMTETEAIGLSAILNSKLFDNYFRAFNGNINVSATELQEMSFPNLTSIEQIGNNIIKSKLQNSATAAEFASQFLKQKITTK